MPGLFRFYRMVVRVTPKAGLMVFVVVFFAGVLSFERSFGSNPLNSSLVLDSVSVSPDNLYVVLGWTLQTDVQDGFIEIHRQLDNGLYAPISQVPLTQSSFIDNGSDPGSKSYSYYIVARHPNGDNIAVSNEAHKTIFLEPVHFDVCAKQISLKWQDYFVTTSAGQPQPLPVPFDSLTIFLSVDGQDFEEIVRLPIQRSELDINVAGEGQYCLKIQSFSSSSGLTSTSNTYCRNLKFTSQAGFLQIRKVSLDNTSSFVEVVLHADNSMPNPAYVLKRLDTETGGYVNLDTIFSTSQYVSFSDFSSRANDRPETYMVEVLDSCRALSAYSIPVSTIFLQVLNNGNFQNELTWNPYNGWDVGVLSQFIWRKTGVDEFEVIATLDGLAQFYTDDLSFLGNETLQQDMSYFISAVENPSNPYGFTDTVLSNIVRIERENEVFIPTAINVYSPIEPNRIFKPTFGLSTPASYSLAVFNRWGQRIFQSSDYTQGWDGRHNGQEAPAGVYTYILEYEIRPGDMQKKAGAFMIIR